MRAFSENPIFTSYECGYGFSTAEVVLVELNRPIDLTMVNRIKNTYGTTYVMIIMGVKYMTENRPRLKQIGTLYQAGLSYHPCHRQSPADRKCSSSSASKQVESVIFVMCLRLSCSDGEGLCCKVWAGNVR
jgi:hypothetical protein